MGYRSSFPLLLLPCLDALVIATSGPHDGGGTVDVAAASREQQVAPTSFWALLSTFFTSGDKFCV